MRPPNTTPALAPTDARLALLVDGDTATRRLCRETLEGLGFLVAVVETGVAAVVAAREAEPRIIFIEAQLVDAPARTVVAWLRENPSLAATPIVLLANRSPASLRDPEQPPGTLLTKPVSARSIRRIIAALLGGEPMPRRDGAGD
ncbi:MAG: hypothetical protein M0002_21340 [Rhodospirillales bacterium]|nr:hypothetical protein [Rhodospirillales bacterium]